MQLCDKEFIKYLMINCHINQHKEFLYIFIKQCGRIEKKSVITKNILIMQRLEDKMKRQGQKSVDATVLMNDLDTILGLEYS